MSILEAQIKLVDSVVLIQPLVEDTVSGIRKLSILVDLEGVNLSRDGAVAVIPEIPSCALETLALHTGQIRKPWHVPHAIHPC